MISGISSGSTLCVTKKKDFQTKEIKNDNYNPTPLNITVDYPRFIVTNKKEESISIQKVNP